jgi:hypothetical protein
VDSFRKRSGTFRFESTLAEPERRAKDLPLGVVLAEGLRSLARGFEVEEMMAALGEYLECAPEVDPTERMIGRLRLSTIEQRVVRFSFNGRTSVRDLLSTAGVGQRTALQLLTLLMLYDIVEWKDAVAKRHKTTKEELEAKAEEMENLDHFRALGVHWSSPLDEIEAAYRKLREETSEGHRNFKQAPEACRRMRERADEAYQVLRNRDRRAEYRRQAHPEIHYAAVQDFMTKKAKSLELRDDARKEVRQIRERMADVLVSKEVAPAKEEKAGGRKGGGPKSDPPAGGS